MKYVFCVNTVGNNSRVFFAVWWLWVFFCSTANVSAQKSGYFTANGKKINITAFNKEVGKMVREVGTPGISLAVISNNKVVFSNGYGYRKNNEQGDEVNNETIFEACSVSKTLLVYIALKLADEGKLDLDRPMYQYKTHEKLQHDPRYKKITSRMVLSHSSGLENWIWDNNRDTLEIIADPGVRYIYSGEGYQYLAGVIETILHMPYETYVKKMILEPLHLNRIFTSYAKDSSWPVNYATGHTLLLKEINKWKNTEPMPAAGVHVSAHDYAVFLVSMFDRSRLSAIQMKNILSPIVLLDTAEPDIWRGTGFEVLYAAGDTIISHSGNNAGFKAFVAYSVKSKNGIVLFTNGDAGLYLSEKLAAVTAGLDVHPFFHAITMPQYPHPAYALLKVYRERGPDAMFSEIDKWRTTLPAKDAVHALNLLSELLYGEDKVTERRLLEDNISRYPEDPEAYFFLGELCMELEEYDTAYRCLIKANEMSFNTADCKAYLDRIPKEVKTKY
nr:serine hydrolase domain-containing protein [uncultured Chitinophaga sp.]